jgi:hypothetical protein
VCLCCCVFYYFIDFNNCERATAEKAPISVFAARVLCCALMCDMERKRNHVHNTGRKYKKRADVLCMSTYKTMISLFVYWFIESAGSKMVEFHAAFAERCWESKQLLSLIDFLALNWFVHSYVFIKKADPTDFDVRLMIFYRILQMHLLPSDV